MWVAIVVFEPMTISVIGVKHCCMRKPLLFCSAPQCSTVALDIYYKHFLRCLSEAACGGCHRINTSGLDVWVHYRAHAGKKVFSIVLASQFPSTRMIKSLITSVAAGVLVACFSHPECCISRAAVYYSPTWKVRLLKRIYTKTYLFYTLIKTFLYI